MNCERKLVSLNYKTNQHVESNNMKRQIAQRVGIIILFLIYASMAQAQRVVSAKSGTIQFVQGEVFLDGRPLQLPPNGYLQMENGQTLQTRRGRLEMLLTPDTYLRLAEDGSLRIEQNRLADTQLVFERGSALIEVVQRMQGSQIRVRFLTGIVEIREAGLYRFDAGSGEFWVYGGSALVSNGQRKSKIKSGRKVRMDGTLTSAELDTNATDDLHKWAAQRSFDLFNVSPTSRMQRHWEPISMGWMINYNYHIRFFSPIYYEQWLAVRASQAAAAEAAQKQKNEEASRVEATNRAMERQNEAAKQSIGKK
jgi:hypothetical protein